ncbi:MAG: PRC-barrel domain-containing protein [Chroococcidiopsidaceae cyanobacterium CP_BM_ER_R8_30]|nr:PRC-barrel domain-containing protein [Chroococcidiopsidaceae cyanobacterium CP_BM_ER_R8_30]
MKLLEIKDFDLNYVEAWGDEGIIGFDVYSNLTNEKVGSVNSILVDEATGDFRYLVVEIGFWVLGKKVLLPVGRSRINYQQKRVYTVGLSQEQAESLPDFSQDTKVDDNYEEQVRGIYCNPIDETSFPTYICDTYPYQRELSLYVLNEREHQVLKWYEERLSAHKNRLSQVPAS